jgi:hypothetical protein
MAAPDVFSKKLLTTTMKLKGKTFQQLNSGIKYNAPTYGNKIAPKLLRRALPLKLYRREIASTNIKCNPRTSLLYQFDNPGSNITTQYSGTNGLATLLDIHYENNTCQHPKNPISTDTTCNVYLSQQNNARRRVRSAGMIRRKFNTNSNNDTYYTDSNQYLTARNRTFKQTQYFHIKQGDATVKPGSAQSYNNIYTANGVSHCPKFLLSTAATFTYNWLDNSGTGTTNSYTVTLPTGSYDIVDFNRIFQSAMYNNNHYLVLLATNTVQYFAQFVFNSTYNKIEFDAMVLPRVLGSTYGYPTTHGWALFSSGNFNPNVTLNSASIFIGGLGIVAGTYPTSTNNAVNQHVFGAYVPTIKSNYIPIYYKPNNPQFGCQGAVSSGDFITRKKYDAITTAANTFRTAFGNQTADAVAYGVPSYGYTLKDRVGFSNIKIPTLNKYNGALSKCIISRRMRNMRGG